MFTTQGRQFTSVAIARLVILLGWTHVPAASPDADGNIVGGCDWLVTYVPEVTYDPETGEAYFWDDPQLPVRECGAEAARGEEGWCCAAGHAHVDAETRDREGWDYAEDAYDAAVITRGGRRPIPMGPTTTIDPGEVAQAMATL